jgi:hypothetical protein
MYELFHALDRAETVIGHANTLSRQNAEFLMLKHDKYGNHYITKCA